MPDKGRELHETARGGERILIRRMLPEDAALPLARTSSVSCSISRTPAASDILDLDQSACLPGR